MGNMIGANPERLRAVAARFDEGATAVAAARDAADTAVDGVEWVGADADAYRTSWRDAPVARLTDVDALLRELAVELRWQADEQEAASAARGRGAGERGEAGDGAGGTKASSWPREGDEASGGDREGWTVSSEMSAEREARAHLGELDGSRWQRNPDTGAWVREQNERFGTDRQIEEAKRANAQEGAFSRWERDANGEWRPFVSPRERENAQRAAEAMLAGEESSHERGKPRLGIEAEVQRSVEATLGVEGTRELRHGVTASGSAGLEAQATASGTIDRDGLRASGSVEAGARAEGSLGWGHDSPFSGTASAEAFAGARADASAGVTWGGEEGLGVKAEVGGFAGAEANVSFSQNLGPFGLEATAGVNAGIGGDAQAGVVFRDGRLHLNLGATAAVGLGANADATLTIDVGSIYDSARSLPVFDLLPERPSWLQ